LECQGENNLANGSRSASLGQRGLGFTDVFWSPLLVNDLAELLDELMGAAVQGILHIPGRDCLSKYEFGRLLARAFGLPAEAVLPGEARQGGFQAPRPGRTCLDGSKASGLLRRELPAVDVGLQRMEGLARTGYLDRLRSMTAG
jgi:dTDP-4-dehydrorhamnose reductase